MIHYRVFLPDISFYQQTVACQFACVVRTDGRACANAIARAFDERGQFNPQLIPNSEKVWECDSVIISTGQTGNRNGYIAQAAWNQRRMVL